MTSWWLVAPLAIFALLSTASNALTWPRGRRGPVDRRVSVLIPARDEAGQVGDAVRAAVANHVHEVLVWDDGSSDDTAREATQAGARVLTGGGLPAGWVGKVHACHRLAAVASGEVLLFLDADVRLEPTGVERILSLARDFRADVVTAVPRQLIGSWAEAAIVPLLHLTYTSWLPLRLIPATRDPRVLAANGQVLAIARAAYDGMGGFEAVRGAVVDDMAICRLAKQKGYRVVFADGHLLARCRMYRDAAGVWEGFSKNVAPGIGSAAGVWAAVALYLVAFVAPWVALAGAAGGVRDALVPGCVGAAANLSQRAALAVRHAHPPLAVAAHVPAVLGLVAIALNSLRWSASGRIRWRGRTYET